jgi:hypothetical protein
VLDSASLRDSKAFFLFPHLPANIQASFAFADVVNVAAFTYATTTVAAGTRHLSSMNPDLES